MGWRKRGPLHTGWVLVSWDDNWESVWAVGWRCEKCGAEGREGSGGLTLVEDRLSRFHTWLNQRDACVPK